jgi:carbon-monoxide dehydrogenase large subunit
VTLVGARVKRREDPRLLTGHGQFVDDIRLTGMLQAAFVRSTVAHADITSVETRAAAELEGVHGVFTGADIARRARPFVCDSEHEGWQRSELPPMAVTRVRFVGETVAAVVAEDRYVAEDAMDFVAVSYAPLPVVATIDDAMSGDLPPLHEGWTGNCFLRRHMEFGDTDAAFAAASGVVSVDLISHRSAGVPLECRGCVAAYDGTDLTLWTSTQIPHYVRTGLADHLGLAEHRVRVVAPDVGGGFGIKGTLYPEEVSVCVLAMLVGRPVKWIEDRQEHLLAALHAREHHHHIEAAYTDDGEVTGLRAEIRVDCGAYSTWPWTAAGEAGMAASVLPGQYRIRNYVADTVSAATNKCYLGAYRAVSRPAANLSMERVMDEVGHRLGLDPLEVRRRNYVRAEEFPYVAVTGLVYDSGSFVESLENVASEGDYEGLRRRQLQARAKGRYLGIGFASYVEQTAHGTRAWASRALPVVPGFDTATLRVDPSGTVTVQTSTHSHGQGHETTFAQIVADELTLPIESVRVRFGDTAAAPYGPGTFASRGAVMGGGAVLLAAREVRSLLLRFASHELEADVRDLHLSDGHVVVTGSPATRIACADLARRAYHHPEKLPEGMTAHLEARIAYDAPPGNGTFSNGAHLGLIEVDVETGGITVLEYWVAEDCGRMINPLIVDGQVHGGVAQALGGALLEELVYDGAGQLTTTTLKDYRLPGATDVPHIAVSHLETPPPDSLLGAKGVGEGGAISPGAVIASAVADALEPLGHVFVNELPLTPARVRRLAAQARRAGAAAPPAV